jgi:hypothetical protein
MVQDLLNDQDVLEGAKTAFSASTHAVFEQFDTTINKDNFYVSNSKLSFEGEDARSFYLQSNLAQFYNVAVRDFARKNDKLKLSYSLESILDVVITSKDIISGPQRDKLKWTEEDPPIRKNFLGIGILVYPIQFESGYISNGFEETKLMLQNRLRKETLERLSEDLKVFTFRYEVDVVCREVFCVQCVTTGEVIQGEAETVTRTHRIVLESAVTLFENDDKTISLKFIDEWSIVDIDDWLQGNKFWVEDQSSL